MRGFDLQNAAHTAARGLRTVACAVAVASLVLAGFVGCGFTSGESDDTDAPEANVGSVPAESAVAVNEGDMITIGFAQVGAESDWRLASSDSIEQAFSIVNGYHLIFEDGQQRQDNQTKAIREFIDQDVDYIILDPIVETGWEASLTEARDAGIPVIIVDRRIAVEDESLYTAWVGADFYLEGQRACEWLSRYIQNKGELRDEELAALAAYSEDEADGETEGAASDEDIEVRNDTSDMPLEEYDGDGQEIPPIPGYDIPLGIAHIQGTIGATAQIGRSAALYQAIEAHQALEDTPEWMIVAAEGGDYVQAKGREVAEAMLAEYGDAINVFYCENDNMAYGAIEAIRAAGRRAGTAIEDGEILVISFDATRQGLIYTLDGTIAVDTECTPDYGPRLSQMIQTLESGGELPKETYVSEGQFSAEHAVRYVHIDDANYKVDILTQDIIDGRTY